MLLIRFLMICVLSAALVGKADIPESMPPAKASSSLNTSLSLSLAEKSYLTNRSGPVTMCVDPSWLPHEKINKEGQHVGMFADYIQLISQRIGIEVLLIPTDSWVQTVAFAKQKKCEIISGISYTEERDAYLDFTVPFLSVPIVVVSNLENPYIDSLNELSGKTLSTVEGYRIGRLVPREFPDIKISLKKSDKDSLHAVSRGEVDAAIGSILGMSYNIHTLGLANLKVIGHTRFRGEYRIAITGADSKLLSLLNKSILSLTEAEKNAIINRWVILLGDKKPDYTLLWQVLMVVAFFAVIVLYRQWVVAKSNQKLSTANNQLQQAYKEQENLIKMFSHEYRTPLSVINSGISLLRKDIKPLPNKVIQRLAMMERATQRLKDIIDVSLGDERIQSLSYSASLEDGHQQCVISDCIKDCLSLYQSAMPNRVVEVIGDANLTVAMSATELARCLDNLVGNALKYSGTNDKPVKITVETMGQYAVIRIKDFGIGIDEEYQSLIFDKYFRAPNAETEVGAGLGLYIVSRMLKRSAGSLEVSSQPGEGSTFVLKIPLRKIKK